MHSSANTSPLLSHAVRVRTKNAELRKKITQLKVDIESIEKEISNVTTTHGHLLEQCQNLREKQTNMKEQFLVEECEKQFRQYIEDIDQYISNKPWTMPSTTTMTTTESALVLNSSEESNLKIDIVPSSNEFSEELSQQLSSVENWLMETAVTDLEKSTSVHIDPPSADDGTDDLYKDLIFPTFTDDFSSQPDENDHHRHQEDYQQKISSENVKQQGKPDKHQRRFALMRQLAEKSNKTVTRKLI